jgi:hypothetical protein
VRRVREERGREPCELHEAYDQGFKAGRDYERVRLDWIEAVREAYEQYQAGWMAALHWQSKQQEEASALGQEVARGIIEDESEDQ